MSVCEDASASCELTSAGAWRPLLVGQLQLQLVLAHLPDEHLQQAANHEQCIVGLPDEQLTVGEEQRERRDRTVRNHTAGDMRTFTDISNPPPPNRRFRLLPFQRKQTSSPLTGWEESVRTRAPLTAFISLTSNIHD